MQIAARTSGGLVRVTVSTGGTQYTSPPTVVIAGASAVAHLDGNRVQSVVITNAGTGFTSNPTVSFQVPSQAVTISSVTAGTQSATVTLSAALSATTWPLLSVGGVTVDVQNFVSTTQLVASTTAVTTGAGTLLETGSGAAATAYAYTGPMRPASFFRGRFNDLYAVDGMGRGIRYVGRPPIATGESELLAEDGSELQTEAGDTLQTEYGSKKEAVPIGLNKPAMGPVITAATTSGGKYVSAIQIVRGGAGYAGLPTVTITGGTPSKNAKARAVVRSGRVDRIFVTDQGAGYQDTPTVEITGGVGTGATFNVGVVGELASLQVTAGGTGYTSNATTSPTVVFHNTNGLTLATARLTVNERGQIDGVSILSGGTGATATGVTASVTGGGGTGAALGVQMRYAVSALTVGNSGSGYYTQPIVTVQRAATDTESGDATANASVNGSGNISSATVISGGRYSEIPTALVVDSGARAQATIRDPLRGLYYCAIRYFDDTPAEENGPVYSSISELVEVDCGDGAASLTWSFDHYSIDDRVTGMELWRSTAEQRTLLFRVGIVKRSDAAWDSSYTESINDIDINDTTRDGYGLMPVTLPSGQVNARRFEVPPGEFAVGVMFQDRAWYAVDTLGLRPNALLYSEIDEPESVPEENELVVQENSATPDKVVALAPLGPALLVVQRSHIYKLMYVAQPIIDASITLVSYRGALHERCWAVMSGVAFLADSNGMYAFDGQGEEAISAPVDDYWRDGIIDFSKADKFHVSADFLSKVVRFHYCRSADSQPVRALCYCVATKAWWEETYPTARTASSLSLLGNRWVQVNATAGGTLLKESGLSDSGTSIDYQYRSGPMPLDAGPSRSVGVVYKPTPSRNDLNLSLHYNNSSSPRENAISTDRGSGFVSSQAGTAAVLDMSQTRSALGEANGFARAYVAGRRDDRSAGGDRHMAVALAGTQSSTAANDGVVIYSLQVEGSG